MNTQSNDLIEFCPAAACAAAIVRLEGFIDHVARLYQEAQLARSADLMRQLSADVGAAVVFLCGPGGSFITGQTINVDGGIWIAP